MAPQSQNEDAPPADSAIEQQAAPGENATDAEPPVSDAPPASPPLPQRHTAVAPGPRASRLQELYAQRLQRTLGKLAWENFAGCYPTVSKKAEGVLRQVQGQMVDKLGEKCEKEFENIMVARQVIPKLNDLESLISDASHRRAELSSIANTTPPTPPHLLPPNAILTAHLHPALVAHQSQLNARLQTTQAQNALLYDEVRRQRAEMAALLDRLDAVVADVQGANDALRPLADDVASETREGLVAVEAASARRS
ncbi:Nnf1-domain-containing protein [Dactylonectria macrodidyma]|uniref:Nnf1-domain-containing protein n=1 Tax=Dactylonectria macrodidyma TaxID=307937 RepID=A0A9P9FNN8_9HYPO|nr:Nnf1-domain-containing protein [Dactylonectria macrodidyma]